MYVCGAARLKLYSIVCGVARMKLYSIECYLGVLGKNERGLGGGVQNVDNNCHKLNISLFVEWRPRTHPLFIHADLGNKLFDQSLVNLNMDYFFKKYS